MSPPESPATKKATATTVAAFKAVEKPADTKKAPVEKTSANLVEK